MHYPHTFRAHFGPESVVFTCTFGCLPSYTAPLHSGPIWAPWAECWFYIGFYTVFCNPMRRIISFAPGQGQIRSNLRPPPKPIFGGKANDISTILVEINNKKNVANQRWPKIHWKYVQKETTSPRNRASSLEKVVFLCNIFIFPIENINNKQIEVFG